MDGFSLEAHKIINLFGLRAVMFPKVKSTSCKSNSCGIGSMTLLCSTFYLAMKQIFKNADVVAAHYFRSLNKIWELYPNAVSNCGSQYACSIYLHCELLCRNMLLCWKKI